MDRQPSQISLTKGWWDCLKDNTVVIEGKSYRGQSHANV
jgi:hypothetical protein